MSVKSLTYNKLARQKISCCINPVSISVVLTHCYHDDYYYYNNNHYFCLRDVYVRPALFFISFLFFSILLVTHILYSHCSYKHHFSIIITSITIVIIIFIFIFITSTSHWGRIKQINSSGMVYPDPLIMLDKL